MLRSAGGPGRYAVDGPPPGPSARDAGGRFGSASQATPDGPALPSQLGLPVHRDPSLGDLGALDLDEPPHRPEPAPPRGGMRQTLGGIALVAVCGLIGMILAGLWATREPPAPPAAPSLAIAPGTAPIAADPSRVSPAPEPPRAKPERVNPVGGPPVPSEAAAPAARPAPRLAPRPAPRPAPVLAPPEPDPSAAVATLEVRGDALVVELRGEFGAFRPGTPVVPGSYRVWADFGSGLVDTGATVEAEAGNKIIAICAAESAICSIIR